MLLDFLTGDKNNINVKFKIVDEVKDCGQIYVTDDIVNVFKQIIGEEKVAIQESAIS